MTRPACGTAALDIPRSSANSIPISDVSKPVHRRTAKNAPLGVDEIAVGRVCAEQLGHFLHEPFEHGLDLELARHDLRCVQERGLLIEPPPILGEQAGRVQRRVDLPLHGVDDEALSL